MIMIAIDNIIHNNVFNVKPSDIKINAIKAKMMVPVEKPIIRIGHIFPSKSWNTIFDAVMAK
jgi:hypothetical protein